MKSYLKPIFKKFIFKVFQNIQRFLSVILADIHKVRTENEVVKPMNPPSTNDLMTTDTAEGTSFNKTSYLINYK